MSFGDLPSNLVGTVPSGAQVDLLEAIGPGPTSEIIQTSVQILGADAHTGDLAPISAWEEGFLAYSYERWIRFRFSQPFGSVYAFRFWVTGSAVPAGWTLLYGTTPTYQTPTAAVSSIATLPVPTSDPGALTPNLGGNLRLTGSQTRYTSWIAIQASASAEVTPTAISLVWNFGWQEV